jgi:multidrug efflux system outer membrane protein
LAPGLPSDILLLRPDVMAAEKRLIAAHTNIDAARAAFLPKVLLTASVGMAGQTLVSLFNGAAWSFAPSITLPLFDGGRLDASMDLAKARKVIAIAEYEKTIQMAFREVADLLSARVALARQVRSAQINEAAQKRRLVIVQARHQVGLVNVLEVLDGERNLMSAQQAVVQLRRAQLDSSAQLYKALGGGA